MSLTADEYVLVDPWCAKIRAEVEGLRARAANRPRSIGSSVFAPPSAPADPGRWYWTCSGSRYNGLLDRARRIAEALDLDDLDDQLRALELAWVQVQVSDDDRLALLEAISRRRRILDARRPPAAGAGEVGPRSVSAKSARAAGPDSVGRRVRGTFFFLTLQ